MCYLCHTERTVFAKLHSKCMQFRAVFLIGWRLTPGWTWLRPFQNRMSLNGNSEHILDGKQYLMTAIFKLYNGLTRRSFISMMLYFDGMRWQARYENWSKKFGLFLISNVFWSRRIEHWFAVIPKCAMKCFLTAGNAWKRQNCIELLDIWLEVRWAQRNNSTYPD